MEDQPQYNFQLNIKEKQQKYLQMVPKEKSTKREKYMDQKRNIQSMQIYM